MAWRAGRANGRFRTARICARVGGLPGMGTAAMTDFAAIVDLDRYPIDRKGSAAWDALVAGARRQHETEGACNLEGFLTAEGIAATLAEANALLARHGYQKTYVRNAYFLPDDPALPADHPLRRLWATGSLQVAYDQIGRDTLLNRLYLWPPLIDFIAAVEERATLHPMADQFQALNVIAHGDGEELAWHYDHNDFTVTLLLQEATEGGEFAFAPDIRTADDPNYPTVARVFDGEAALVRRPHRAAGTLTLFRGRNSLHRVDPCHGPQPRITAILTYDERPDCRRGLRHNVGIYGPRLEALARERGLSLEP